MLRADHQKVALKLPADLLLDTVVHVRRVIRVELVDDDLLGQLDGQPVPVDGDLLHQLPALDPDCGREEESRRGGKRRSSRLKRGSNAIQCVVTNIFKNVIASSAKKIFFYMIYRTINHRNMLQVIFVGLVCILSY